MFILKDTVKIITIYNQVHQAHKLLKCIDPGLLFKLSRPQFGEGNGTPLQYSCLENPMDGGAW